MPALKDFSVTLDPLNAANQTQSGSNSRKSSGSATSTTNAASLKKAKWHLGIRSQSKPQDIMNEVFKAMKELGLEWKFCNNSMYTLRARRKVTNTNRYVKLGLQLYQVDHRSYLLDFRNLNANSDGQSNCFLEDNETENAETTGDSGDNENTLVSSTNEPVSEVMEFFEVAASLIRTLAPDPGSKPAPTAAPVTAAAN